MSFVYGPPQCGNEDQGWGEHVVSARATPADPVRRRKHVLDGCTRGSIEALLRADAAVETLGRAFNSAGLKTSEPGLAHSLIVAQGEPPLVSFGPWRQVTSAL